MEINKKIISHKIWEFWAPRYERLWAQHFSLKPSRDLIHRHIEKSNIEPKRILDIGCGIGQLAYELALRWPMSEIVALDSSPGMILRAKNDYFAPNIKHIHTSFENYEDTKLFSLIVSTHSFPYFMDKKVAMKHIYDLLDKDGRCLIIQANNQGVYDRIWLFFVKFTVSKGEYLSINKLRKILKEVGFRLGVILPIDKAVLIPSIFLVEGIKD
jgi:trans-aconitate methyltransferase